MQPTSQSARAAPAIRHRVAWGTLLLCAATATVSVFAAIEASGTWLGRVRIADLEPYGLRFAHLHELALWRLVTAQLVHVKQAHMLSNVFCMLVIGAAVERHLGFVRLLLLWLIGGSIATLISTLFATPAWDLGTGASQAIMAFAGAGLWLRLAGVDRSTTLLLSLAWVTAVTVALDLVHAHHLKPGHVAGLMLGLLIASRFRTTAQDA